jgi:predicted enzyme related to lactoylglutathione lyase
MIHGSTFSLVVRNLPKAIEFYQQAFQFALIDNEKTWATLQYNHHYYCLIDEQSSTELLGYPCQSLISSQQLSPINFFLETNNVDKTFQHACQAGAKAIKKPQQNDHAYYALVWGVENYTWCIISRALNKNKINLKKIV